MLRVPEIIDRKRRGQRLSRTELETLVLGYTRGEIPDYQVAAWLMAVCLRGMEVQEVADLTDVMADSGRRLDLSGVAPMVADKHSTGGVGDKTSLVVIPLAAACGLPVAKMSGRGLGFSGGTLDKLESIPGLNVNLSCEQFVNQVRAVGLGIVGQSPELAPADGKLYALRDVTATVESIPLIASSVMSKKLAAGSHVIVLDVKVGSGAFMRTAAEARELAETMVRIGHSAGRRTAALVTEMSQPLGRAVGNALEVAEVVDALQGRGPSDLVHLAVELAAEMLVLAGGAVDREAGRSAAEGALRDGRALEKLQSMVRAQGGDERCIERPQLLPRAPLRRELRSPADGVLARADARTVAEAVLVLGAGRERKGDPIDHAVGVVLEAKIGDRISRGQPLAVLHGSDQARLETAARLLAGTFEVVEAPVTPAPLIQWRSN